VKTLTLALTIAGIACAQTQVRPPVVLPSYKNLKYAPLPPLNPPKPAEVTLPNGMKVFLLEDHELPVVSGFALVRTGNLFDPPDKIGLAGLTGDVLRSGGTKAETGDQIDVDLENVAASIESGIGEGSGNVSFSALKENTDQVLALFKDLLTAPEFREDKLELAKTQLRSGISRRNDDPGGIMEREFASILYGRNTPYGWDVEYADVDNIHRADLRAFYKRYYFPANVMLAVYGDFDVAEMQRKLTALFADWTATQPAVPKFPEVNRKPAPGVYLATKTDVTQTFFEVGHLGGELNDKDYPALEVMSQILGGGFSSRLLQRIRTELGYAYNISAAWAAQYDHPGMFVVSGSTQSMHTVDSLREVSKEINRIRTAEVTDQELHTAKETVLNAFVFRFDKPSKTLNRLITYRYYGYPEDFVFQYQKAIAAVTKADVLRVAKDHLKPEQLTIVAVGNPKDFKTPLTELGMKVEPIDLTIPEPKHETAKSDGASLAKGKQLLQRMQQALGGAEKLAAIKDFRMQSEVTIQTPGAAMKIKQTNSFVLPSNMRQDVEMGPMKQTIYSDGSAGWISSPQGMMAMPPAVVKQAGGEVFRELHGLALSDRDADRTVNLAGNGEIEISDKQGNSVRIKIDEKTGLPATLIYKGNSMGGPPADVEEQLSGWREVDGIQVPFQRTVVQGGKKFADAVVQSAKFNSGLTPAEIAKKP
jgi:zinc protease